MKAFIYQLEISTYVIDKPSQGTDDESIIEIPNEKYNEWVKFNEERKKWDKYFEGMINKNEAIEMDKLLK